jgi:hypothetical protein
VAKGLEGTNAEHLEGTEFADVLLGDGGPNTIVGLGDDDELDGRGGADRLDAGAGADALQTRDGVADTADCGSGADTVTADPPGIDLLAGCESSIFPGSTGSGGGGGPPGSPSPAAFGARTLVTLTRARIPAGGPLAIRLSNANGFQVTGTLFGQAITRISPARRRGRFKLQAKPFSVPASAAATVELRLPKALRRQLARKHVLTLRLRATLRDPAGNTRTVNKTVMR